MNWLFGKKFKNETHKELYEKIEQFSAKWSKDLKLAGINIKALPLLGGEVQSVGENCVGDPVLIRWGDGNFYIGKGYYSRELGPGAARKLKPERNFNHALTISNVLGLVSTSVKEAIQDKKSRDRFESVVLEKVDNIL